MSHPKVYQAEIQDMGDGAWFEVWLASGATPTHKVVPLSAVVIERDENDGREYHEWRLDPDAVRYAMKQSGVDDYEQAYWAMKCYLDALAAGEADTKETK